MGYALITGASKGIGKAIAYELAAKGYNLLLTARNEAALQSIAQHITGQYKVNVQTLAIDLALPETPRRIFDWVTQSGANLNVLINNAGYGIWGRFGAMPLNDQLDMLEVNVTVVVKLTHLLLPLLLRNPNSYILNVASTTAYQAVPAMAVYGAGKAFVVSYSRALAHELKGTNVSVSCLSPGATDTGFMDRAKMDDAKLRKQASQVDMTPAAVAKIAVAGMLKGKMEIIPGLPNILTAIAAKLLPKIVIEKIVSRIYLR